MNISVVTAYYNRKKLFYNTLLSLRNSFVKDFEVIAVDDGSTEDNRLEDLQAEFSFLKVIRLEPKDKWYSNPCIPFNIGFAAATGDIVIIQNPECLHYGDIFSYVMDHLKPNDYISFASYSLDREITDNLTAADISEIESASAIHILQETAALDGDAGWYNHSRYDPRGMHWCSAIRKRDLEDLGGFDDRFALGVAFDDDEFLMRIKKKGMNFRIIDSPFVLHQNHYFFDLETKKNVNQFFNKANAQFLWKKNQYLAKRTSGSKNWKAQKHSKTTLFFLDFTLTAKLKFYDNLQYQYNRGRNKIRRMFSI